MPRDDSNKSTAKLAPIGGMSLGALELIVAAFAKSMCIETDDDDDRLIRGLTSPISADGLLKERLMR